MIQRAPAIGFVAIWGFVMVIIPSLVFRCIGPTLASRMSCILARPGTQRHQDTYLSTPGDQAGQDYSAAGAPGSGRIDHVCFNCEGIEEFVERLTRNGIEFSERKAHNSDLFQLFMRGPINGIQVELNFSAEEAIRSGRAASCTSTGDNVKAVPR